MKILLTAAHGSPYPYLYDSLYDLGYEIILVDSAERDKIPFDYSGNVRKIRWLEQGYFEDIQEIIKKEKPDFYIPMLDEEILWAHDQNVNVLSPAKNFCSICLNKEKLMQYLKDLGISTVKTWAGAKAGSLAISDKNQIEYPCVVKPITGRGSRGFCKLWNAEHYLAYLVLEHRQPETVIRQEFLEGQEYTVSVVVNNRNQLMSIVPKRVLEKRGVTIRAVTEKNEAIHKVCESIVNKMFPFGTFNVQLIMVNGVPKIFEINPRLSTTSILTTEAGVNEIDLMIQYWNKLETPYFDFDEGLHLYRRWESIFYE